MVTDRPLATGERAGYREWAGLAVLALPTLLLAVDNSVLFLALPHLSEDLAPTGGQQLWIMDSYGFMIAGFLVTMGTLGDRVGRRRLLMSGAAAFGVVSVLAAYAPSAEALIAARALLGVAGATLMPSTLALITEMFTDRRQRALAIGVFMSCFMGGAVFGPVVGGFVLQRFWWGAVFLMGVPVMLLLLATGPLLLPQSRGNGRGRLDLVSVALSLAAILPVIYGLKAIAANGASWTALLVAAAGGGFGALFVRRQRTLADPLLDLRLFANRSFSAALVILLFAMCLQGGVYLLVGQYLQMVEGLSPLAAGIWMAPPAVALGIGSVLSPLLARRFRPGVVIGGGLLLSVPGFLLLAVADHSGGPALLVAATTIGFLGTAPIGALGIDLVVGSAPPERAGAASSVAETSGEFGIAFGVAAFGSVGAAVYQRSVADSIPRGVPPEAADAARETLPGAVAAVEGLPGDTAGELLGAAQQAFTTGLTTVAGLCAVVVAVLAVLSLTVLRGLRTA
ncbi:DHA2 family multidrug resistance protein-like MFS transporter [Saccharopolyspora erythraea NRRL 2338]|uniref:Proton antiporter efflux pump n=2 Tax=Saccharopolyspora erythraea TaxID=1836 RepID=A4F8W0_SACEN|nr:MFS transporter [Saccharopolyspora erythraea]EQD86734.1 MFS transporter [Saccharopolyspora erythraea D]PFG94282.1 DHA2 family multidrug resistance protein-like MFS transporter [Saccharopolyspora erythraea NRRL 2338]QRK91052.1 MFS transporter [Saccharopolyspora erythraea]CAM00485.1 proton antiporter efflux pump [Saccharopolyspora erythraea NRRL 2338]